MSHRLFHVALAGGFLAVATAGARSIRIVAEPPQAARVAPHHTAGSQRGNDPLPVEQLARAKRASARYRDVKNALADGYADINVVIPNMGRHFLKGSLLDATFDIEHPEILVYAPDRDSTLQLVAVEYAVPESLSVSAPEGFAGKSDEWFVNQAFGIWTLHAWVWKKNPAGIFYPTNPDVQ